MKKIFYFYRFLLSEIKRKVLEKTENSLSKPKEEMEM